LQTTVTWRENAAPQAKDPTTMPTDPTPEMMAAIRLWTGVACPNPAGARALEDFPALIAEFEALRGARVVEDEPSSFEAALRAEQEPGA
jgi:hypothetical protein